MEEFKYLGRMRDICSVVREREIQSKQMGRRENKIINIEGRVQFDLLQVGYGGYTNGGFIYTIMCGVSSFCVRE